MRQRVFYGNLQVINKDRSRLHPFTETSPVTPRCMLLIFARFPEPGVGMTRLAAGIGTRAAGRIYRHCVEHTLSIGGRWASASGGHVRICTAGDQEQRWRKWLGNDWDIRPQHGEDLGRRMSIAQGEALSEGCERAVCIGTDAPGLTRSHISSALRTLEDADAVVGASPDGGYYLIGLRDPAPTLFRDIPWSTPEVLPMTRAAAQKEGRKLAEIEPLNDIDIAEDLRGAAGPTSVIIPTLNEGQRIAETVRMALDTGVSEVIVADGGSADGTRREARSAGARVVKAPAGRGPQLNTGARAATGETLWFLHADCRLQPLSLWEIGQALRDEDVVGGAFQLRIEPSSPWLRFLALTANWRTRLFGKPYGDQAMFVRRGAFRAAGGFPDWPLMEDVELARRLRREGRLELLPLPSVSSARRWQSGGVLRTYLTMKMTLLGYYLGEDPDILARLYGRTGT